ncbi:hypothetical protein [Viridibacillus arvi]|uniref:hypothetical protein n=1 Tax=Viridibacillus arvi TaxID=263475 RepID=UPI003D0287AC
MNIGFQVTKSLLEARENTMQKIEAVLKAIQDNALIEHIHLLDDASDFPYYFKEKFDPSDNSVQFFRRLIDLEELYVNNAKELVKFHDKYLLFQQGEFSLFFIGSKDLTSFKKGILNGSLR